MAVLRLAGEPADKSALQLSAPPEPDPEVDLRQLIRALWRRKATIAATVIVMTALSAVVLYQIEPRYRSEALVMIDPRETQFVDIEAVMSGLPRDLETIQSEIEIIKSRSVADKVIRKLKLYNDPEFNARLRPEPFLRPVASEVADRVKSFFFSGPQEPPVPLETQFDKERVMIIDEFVKKLEVRRRGQSRVIEVAFESENPHTAALVANTIADLYLVEQLEAKFEMTQRATLWLSDRLSELRSAVESSELAVEKFRASAGLIEGEDATIAVQQISELNTQLVLARSARAEAEARLRQVQLSLQSANNVNSAAEVLSSPLIQRLREQEAEIERKIAELSTEYGEKHPRMINTRAELRDLRSKISGEVNKIVQNLRSEVSVARARESSLQSSLDELEQQVGGLKSSEVQLRALQREANANRELYETFLSRFKETSNEKDMQQTDARIIARAELPERPSFPKTRLILALVVVGSIFLGIVLVFVIEQLDQGFRSMSQVRHLLGVPAIGMVPAVGRASRRPEKYGVEKPNSVLAESIRMIYASLLLASSGAAPKVVLVTSALPREGKTTISLLLGRISAQAGKRAIIIDTDLRRSQVHTKLNLPGAPGLVEYLTGEASLEQVIHKDKVSGANVIPAGKAGPDAAGVLNSESLQKLLAGLAEHYELVVLDSPPVSAVADARILTHHADKTIMVVRWAATRREVAAMAIGQLLDAGGKIAGVVLSNVNVRKNAGYGYGDSGYYHGALRTYYSG